MSTFLKNEKLFQIFLKMNPIFETKQILEESNYQIFIEIKFKYGLIRKNYEVQARMNGGNIFDDMIEKWNFNRVENELSEPQLFLSSNSNIFMKNTPSIKYLVFCCIILHLNQLLLN